MQVLARSLILIVVITGLAACARFKAPQDNPVAQLPYSHSSDDLEVAWNTLHTGNDTAIDGFIKNVRYLEVQDIDLTVKVIDSGGGLVAGVYHPVPIPLAMNESVSFSVKLNGVTIVKGNVLEFIIRYHANDGGRKGFDWLSSFKVDAVTGVAIVSSASEGIAGAPYKELPLPVNAKQELDRTIRWLKIAIESISITLIPIDPDHGIQYYSHYSFENEGCAVNFSYEFNYYLRMTHERKTSRLGSTFNLKDIGSLEVAPFVLTHMQTQLYSINGNNMCIPVKNAEDAEQIAKKLDQARRLCGATTELN